MPAAVRTLTDFLQHSGRILPEIERGEIVLRRREGDDLVVVSQKHWEALCNSFLALAEAYCDTQAGHCGSEVKRADRFALPWISLLNEEDRAECQRELTLAAIAALEYGRFSQLVQTIAQWRATALATWDDERREDQIGYGEDHPVQLVRP